MYPFSVGLRSLVRTARLSSVYIL